MSAFVQGPAIRHALVEEVSELEPPLPLHSPPRDERAAVIAEARQEEPPCSLPTAPAESQTHASNGRSSVLIDANDGDPFPAIVAPLQREVETPETMHRVFDVAPLNVMNKPRRTAITVLIIMSNIVQMIANFVGFAGGLKLSQLLGAQGTQATWIAASYPLTQGTFVLISGRMGAVYGHKNMLLGGGAWLTLCTLACGYCDNFIAFTTFRALSGIGGAFIMPNAVAMLAITNPPGPTRNLSLGFFGASAPLGGYLGAVLLGAFVDNVAWKWLFFFVGILSAFTFFALAALLPREVPVDRGGKIDWIGAGLGTSALIIFNFCLEVSAFKTHILGTDGLISPSQAPGVGWSTSYEIALLIVSILLFVSFAIWERYVIPYPIMPLDIFKAPSFVPLIVVSLLNYMAVGTLIWYQVLWLQEVWHYSLLHLALAWSPFVIFATVAACLAGWLIPRLAAQWILAIGTVTILLANLLMATVPMQQTYWAQVFPSVIFSSFCPDLVYTAAQIIASNSVRRNQQGVAGSLIGTLNLYGNSLGLGFASTIETQVARRELDPIKGYRAALFFGVGISVVALLLDIFFVRLVRDERQGWEDENDADPADEVVELASTTSTRMTSQGATTTATELPSASQRT